MAAPRNDEERERLYQAAMRLFAERGYTKTTYSDIARACDTTKSMVQHYFPKKDLFVTVFFERHLESIAQEAQAFASDDPLRMFCAMGLRHFDMLLNDETLRLFSRDVLASRELTDAIVKAERNWAKERLTQRSGGSVSVEDALTVSLGGAYELVFQAMQDGVVLDAQYVERAGIIPFALVMGYSREQVEAVLDECAAAMQL